MDVKTARITDDDKYLRSNNFGFQPEENEVKVIKRIAREAINKMIDEGFNIEMIKVTLAEAHEIIKELKPSR